MKFKKYIIAELFILAVIAFNLITLFQLSDLFFSFYNTLFILTVPGFLLLLTIHKKVTSIAETVLFSVVLSIAFLFLTGLGLQLVFSFFHQMNPLEPFSLLLGIDAGIIVLSMMAFFRTNRFSLHVSIPRLSPFEIVMTYLPMLFVLLSIAGTIQLNNGASNILTMIMLSSMTLYGVFVAVYFRKQSFDYAIPIYFMGLAILLMLSMRSWYVTGWDIQEEYIKFVQTLAQHQWSTVIDKSAYNACLSITMLPTILTQLTHISPENIFRIVFQCIFAFMPVSLYLLMSQYTDKVIAFLAAFYVIAQPFFIQPMTSVMRQEIAFLFFTTILLTLYHKTLSGRQQRMIIVLSILGLVFSHYSTSYLAIFIFSTAYGVFLIYRLLLKIPKVRWAFTKVRLFEEKSGPLRTYITIPFLILLISSTFVWYSVINRSPDNLYTITIETLHNAKAMFQFKQTDQAKASITLFSKEKNDTVRLVNEFIREKKRFYQSYYLHHYSEETYKDFKVTQYISEKVPPLIDTPFNKQGLLLLELTKQLSKVLILAGALYILIFVYRKKDFPQEYLIIGFNSLLLIGLMLFHPTLSLRYNVSRLYLQLLSVLSLFAIFGSFAFTFSLRRRIQTAITAGAIGIVLLYHFGVINQLLGGTAYMHLNNYGDDYDKFYVHTAEIRAGEWLKQNSDPYPPLFADSEAYLRLYKTKNKYALPAILPQFIQKSAYVYASKANVTQGRTQLTYRDKNLLYMFPLEFLNENKNLIYSNKSSHIYK